MDDKLPFAVEHVAGLARPRYGNANPEYIDNRFWEYMVRNRRQAYWARKTFKIGGGGAPPDTAHLNREKPDGPVWCFERFGQTISQTRFANVYVGGEHEDWYDPDFCIYNDVVVEESGGISILGYPSDVFPPTDFHSATVVSDHIWLIGNLGYKPLRRPGETQVMRLELEDYRIEAVETFSDNPGWISRHRAYYDIFTDEIRIYGGEIWQSDDTMKTNDRVYALPMKTLEWRDLGPLPVAGDA